MMGDANPLSPTERQFQDDLEKAKRLSLETFEKEKVERNGCSDQRRLSDGMPNKLQNLDIRPRPRPFSTSAAARNSSSPSPGKVFSIPSPQQKQIQSIPPPNSFKRHRSLPYRVKQENDEPQTSLSSNDDNILNLADTSGNEIDSAFLSPSSSSNSGDLILLTSPKLTHKFDQSAPKNNSYCDNNLISKNTSTFTPFINSNNIFNTNSNFAHKTNGISSSSTIPIYSTSIMPSQQRLNISGNSPNNFYHGGVNKINGTHFSHIGSTNLPNRLSPSPTTMIQSPNRSIPSILQSTTTQINKNVAMPNTNNITNTNNSTPITNREQTQTVDQGQGQRIGNNNFYKNLFDELKDIKTAQDDLIDFGLEDGKNILEYFDPLTISGNNSLQKSKSNNENKLKMKGGSKELVKIDEEITKDKDKEKERSSTMAESNYYPESCISTATSAFSYNPGGGQHSMSLYPSLEEFQKGENMYGGSEYLNTEEHQCSSSSYFDIYNPFEYLYAVSCSSPSASTTNSLSYEPITITTKPTTNPIRNIGFTQLPVPVLPPDLPPRNAEIGFVFNDQTDSDKDKIKQFTPSKIELRKRKTIQDNDKTKRSCKLYENIESVKHFASTDSEIQSFYEMLRELRFSCRHVDSSTNKGYIKAATMIGGLLKEDLSVKIIVWKENFDSDPVTFTCDVLTPVEIVVEQCVVELELEASARDFILRVKGMNEYFDPEHILADYRYIQDCVKLDNDILLVLVNRTLFTKEAWTWARNPRDDALAVSIEIDHILPEAQSKTITYKDISIPLEVLDKESDRIKERLSFLQFNKDSDIKNYILSSSSLIQPVKAVCVLLGSVETVEIVNSLTLYAKACEEWNKRITEAFSTEMENNRRRTKIGSDCGNRLSYVEILPGYKKNNIIEDSLKDYVKNAIERLEDSVRTLVEMYSKSFPVSFKMKENQESSRAEWNDGLKSMADMIDVFIIKLGGVHRLKPEWKSTYVDYSISVEVFHGTRWMGKTNSRDYFTISQSSGNLFFNAIIIDSWISFEHLPVCILPRESRVVFTLFGRKQNEDNGTLEPVELGWASMHCFNFKGSLAQGNYLLPFWPVGLIQKRLGPAPNSSFSSDGNAPLITIEFREFGYELYFPEIPSALPLSRDFQSLDNNTQILLKEIVENSTFTKFPSEEREILWEKRHYLHEYPSALPKVLLSAVLWDWASLGELHAMLQHWSELDPVDALQLLLPCFPDARVREEGIKWISAMPDEELINLLPQLVEALSYETFDLSPLARFLLKKALSCLKFSHYLFWLLSSQVGLGKWSDEEGIQSEQTIISKNISTESSESIYDPKRRRLELMLNSLMVISGAKWKAGLISQFKIIEGLTDVANQVKASKESARSTILIQELRKMDLTLFNSCSIYPLPLSPSYSISSIDIKSCSYFNSASLPLKITFVNGLQEGGTISSIFKIGDDLRQDMLTIQIIRVIEKWWSQSGLDLRVLTFMCIPTGYRQGLVEMVQNAETLCRIQAEYGVTGAFRNRPIAEWLAKMNPSTLDYRRAIDNFTLSCAAYCVVTYILGICDRHNDNIMLTKKGHLFHIDFGKFLGDAQMFGSFKRDRTPFILTSDMVYVINDGEKSSHRFHRFVELCCEAFKIVRQNGNILLNLFALMATAGIPGVDLTSVSYVQRALLPECSNVEAAAKFTRLIEESLQNWFTPVNFFIHSLAQLRFNTDTTDNPTTLSFVPSIFTMEIDGRIEKSIIVSYHKKYDPEKYYLYTIKVKRKGHNEWSYLHRSYKEFLELYTKLCINFPMAVGSLKALPRGTGLGRSNVKQVADKRKFTLQLFLESLFTLADEISHSDLVYSFFHPLLRDEEQHLEDEIESLRRKSKNLDKRDPSKIHGQIKLSIEYQRGQLLVLILHAVDLSCPNQQPPNPYVKTYLMPDPPRLTKRKTRVVRKTQHPTFMEMIEYRLPLDVIRNRILQVSVWHHDPLQENNFLGGTSIHLNQMKLDRETTDTYPLGNITLII